MTAQPSPYPASGITAKKTSAKGHLWVVPVRWSDGEFINPDTVSARVDEAIRFYSTESNGSLNLTRTTLPVETATRTCSPPASSLSRKVARKNPGIDSGDDVVVLVFPQLSDCGDTAEGVGGESDYAWNLAACWDGAEDAQCLKHELGHAMFNLHHDNLITCADGNGNPISYGGECVLEEYLDPYTVMGNGPHGAGLNVDDLISAGFRPTSSAVYAATSTTVTLSPRSGSSGTLMAVVPLLNRGGRGGSRSHFQLEYRTATGTDAWLGDPSVARSENPGTGVLVSLVGDSSPYAELDVPMTSFGDPLDRGLLNMHPEAQHLTPGMQAGDAWVAPGGSVRISVLSETPDAAVVRIDHARDTTAPYPFKVDRPSTFSLGRKSRVFINFDTPGDNVAVKRFKIKISGRPAFSVPGDQAVQRVSQGEVMRVLPTGRYKLQVVAEDYSGNQTRSNKRTFVVR